MTQPGHQEPARVHIVPRREVAEGVSGVSTAARRPRSPRVPRFVATLVGIAGIISLLSAAISPLQQRVQVLTGIVPLAVSATATSVAALAGSERSSSREGSPDASDWPGGSRCCS